MAKDGNDGENGDSPAENDSPEPSPTEETPSRDADQDADIAKLVQAALDQADEVLGEGETPKATTDAPTAEQLAERLAETEALLEAEEAKSQRYSADFQNLKRRSQQEAKEAKELAGETAARQLIPAVDNLTRALENAGEEKTPLSEGVAMTLKQLHGVLESLGVTPLEAEGQPFDPNLHEAISIAPDPSVTVDTVGTVHKRGYMINNKVLCPATVTVLRTPDSIARGVA